MSLSASHPRRLREREAALGWDVKPLQPDSNHGKVWEWSLPCGFGERR